MEDSSSDEEALRRCEEAVWEVKAQRPTGGDPQQSRRVVAVKHEHDGNELQVTQGFRTHVARKLEDLLDSVIAEAPAARRGLEHAPNAKDGDEGFRLFTTSIPGTTAPGPQVPVRRPPVPSSSDSDSEMESRLKEAAVSVKDLLPSPGTLASSEHGREEEDVVEEKKNKQQKKKKKKKRAAGGSEDTNGRAEHDLEVKVKRKKKRRDGNAEREATN